MPKPPDGTPGKRPSAPSLRERPLTLLLRKTKAQALIAGWNPNIWGEDDYCILDGDVVVGRIYAEIIKGEPRWMWFLQTEPAPPPNSGVTSSLEEAKAGFGTVSAAQGLPRARGNRVLLYNSEHGRCAPESCRLTLIR
jgi:hypothetical protein